MVPPDPTLRAYVRRFPRRRVDLRLLITDERGQKYRGRCNSASEGGFGAVLAGELADGQLVTVEFTSRNGGTPVRLMAQLRYRNGFQHGFEFAAPGEAQRQLIAEFFHDSVSAPGD